MLRMPERCAFRAPIGGSRDASCSLIGQILGLDDADMTRVGLDSCEQCCQTAAPVDGSLNPVVVSLVFAAANRVLERGGAAGCDPARATSIRGWALDHLPSISSENLEPGHGPKAVGEAAPIAGPKSSPREPGKVGLVGWNTASGLGYMNRDLANHAAIDRWMIPDHPAYALLEDPASGCRIDHVPREIGGEELRSWMEGLDWVIFVEIPYLVGFAEQARAMGIRVAFVPMWELSHPQTPWLKHVDLVLCATEVTYRIFTDWRRRFGFTWDIDFIPWPIDVAGSRSGLARFAGVSSSSTAREDAKVNGPMARSRHTDAKGWAWFSRSLGELPTSRSWPTRRNSRT